jgi:hypothetical protein
MHNSKLLKLLKTLSKEEFRLLKKFLRSPFYNYTPQLLELYDILKKYYPDFDSPKLEKEWVFKRLFPDESFKSKKMRHTLSEFTLLVEEFMVAMKLRNDTFLKKKLLTEEYGKRNVYDIFERNTQELIEELENAPVHIETYGEISALSRKLFFHPLTRKNKLSVPSLNRAMEYLDLDFALQKLFLTTEMKVRENILQEKYQIQFLEELMAQNHEDVGIFKLLMESIRLFEKNDEASFLKVKDEFSAHADKLSSDEAAHILTNLLNYTIPKVNSGNSFYLEQLFALYKIGLESKLLIQDDRITDFSYTNIIAVGSGLKEYEWTKQFIEEYEVYLDEEIREGAKLLGLAFWHFHQGEFSVVIDLLSIHKFNQVIHELRSRSLQLRAYYELFQNNDSYYEFLISNTYAFEKYIRRNEKISDSKAEGYLNLISYTRKLTNILIKQERKENVKSDLNKALMAKQRFVAKKWILEKIDAL